MSEESPNMDLGSPQEVLSLPAGFRATNEISPEMEKVFMNWVLENPSLINDVHPAYFANKEIQFVYNSIKSYWLETPSPKRPSDKQIRLAVRSLDPKSEKVSDSVLKSILKVDWSQYETTRNDKKKPWLVQRFEAWVMRNAVYKLFTQASFDIRETPPLDYDKVNELKLKIERDIKKLSFLGTTETSTVKSFFDPKAHVQSSAQDKISSGYDCIDEMIGGGFDYKTLYIWMGSTGSGKTVWMCNLAGNIAAKGKNVLYVTLELADAKVLKRIGSKALKIPISEYDTLSKDESYMEDAIRRATNKWGNGILSEPGQLYVQEFPTSSLTISKLESFLEKLEREKNVDFDFMIVDYMNLMIAENGSSGAELYSKGKELAEGLRRIAQTYNLCVMTPSQVSKEAMDSVTVNITDIPESKAIAETADGVFASIRTNRQRAQNIYELLPVKLRDADFSDERFIFDFDKKYLSIQNGRLKPKTI
jgi:archaellum biogenesis ATPase FlaH